jgi:hypothetical protein
MSGGREVWDLPPRPSVRMFSSSCRENGGPCLSACPSTHYDLTLECSCMSEIEFLDTLETSASGLVLSKTLMFSSFQV